MIRAFLESLHAGNRFRLVQEDALPEALWADDKSAAHRFQHLRQKALVRAEGSALQCDIRDVRLYASSDKGALISSPTQSKKGRTARSLRGYIPPVCSPIL